MYMGQGLFQPPSVEGWHKGMEWIDSGTLLERVNFIGSELGHVKNPEVRAIIDRLAAEGEGVFSAPKAPAGSHRGAQGLGKLSQPGGGGRGGSGAGGRGGGRGAAAGPGRGGARTGGGGGSATPRRRGGGGGEGLVHALARCCSPLQRWGGGTRAAPGKFESERFCSNTR